MRIEYPDITGTDMSATPITGLRIALGCQSRVGKDTFADRAQQLHGGIKLSFASRLYEICNCIQRTLGMVVAKDPTLLQRQGTELRAYYGDDLFARKVAEHIATIDSTNPTTNIYVTDLRSPVEFETLKSLGFTMVRVIKPDRVIDRDPNHSTEVALVNYDFDYVIINDGDMDYFETQIDATIDSIRRSDPNYVPTAGSSYAVTKSAGAG